MGGFYCSSYKFKKQPMKTFKIEVKETLSRVIEIEANSNEEALSKIEELYNQQEIVLDSTDFVETEFFEMKE